MLFHPILLKVGLFRGIAEQRETRSKLNPRPRGWGFRFFHSSFLYYAHHHFMSDRTAAGLLAMIGISGDSLSAFIFAFFKYLKNRRVVGKSEEGTPPRSMHGGAT
jgi:dolichol kinase